jgi:hypothetical protein
MIVNRSDAPILNERLAAIWEIVNREANDAIKNGVGINLDAIKEKVWGVKDAATEDPLFLEWVEKQIDILNIAPGTRRQYRSLLIRLTEFDRFEDGMTSQQRISSSLMCSFIDGRRRMVQYSSIRLSLNIIVT